MNIEAKSAKTSKMNNMNETASVSSANVSKATNAVAANGKTFKDELNTKSTDKTVQEKSSDVQNKEKLNNIKENSIVNAKSGTVSSSVGNKNEQAVVETQENAQLQTAQIEVQANMFQPSTLRAAEKITVNPKEVSKNTETKSDKSNAVVTTAKLNSELENINAVKNIANTTVNKVSSKTQDKTLEKTGLKEDYCKTLKMNDSDITFFLNLVDNQQMTAQVAQTTGAAANIDNNFTEIKSEATQQSVQVSSVLMDALNQSSQTGKSVRIDFDDNIAVVMKLDKNGVISANFIPGDTAVENYLRNNISVLQQNFNDKNIAYNELTYSKQQKQQQQEQQKNKDKEQENE